MADNPYQRFQDTALILRDELAIDRTILANERTVLAYLRSALSLVIVGVTFLHFVEKGLLLYLGMGFIPLGVAVGIFGVLRYRKMNAGISTIRRTLNAQPAAGRSK
jgi:putative membrane protein